MRLRNVKGAKEVIENSEYVIKNKEEYRGKYNKLFGNNKPVYLEIGMGKGRFIIENAKRYPEINFIGVEMFDSVLVRAIESITEEIPNLKFIKMDATYIEDVFDKDIDLLYLNFSDPWPKNRHEHRRLTSDRFLKRYDSIFKKDKKIIMKTDNRHLFEFSLISLTNYGYKMEELSLDLHKDDMPDNIETEYEEKFSSKGFPIYRVYAKK